MQIKLAEDITHETLCLLTNIDAVITGIHRPLPAGERIREEDFTDTRLFFRRDLETLGSAVNGYRHAACDFADRYELRSALRSPFPVCLLQ